MFNRQVASALQSRLSRQLVQQQRRHMSGGHGPIGPHLLGTRQADYIQQHSLTFELPPPPGTYGEGYSVPMYALAATTLGAIPIIRALYAANVPIRVNVEKVTVTHPDSGEDVCLIKPTGIHKDALEIWGYDLVQQPQLEYTRAESITAERMARYNDEMDFWLQHGANSQKELGRPFRLFQPDLAIVSDRQDWKRFLKPE